MNPTTMIIVISSMMIQQLEEISIGIQTHNGEWDKYAPQLVALVTVVELLFRGFPQDVNNPRKKSKKKSKTDLIKVIILKMLRQGCMDLH